VAKGRTQKETVAILQKTFPKFNKVAASMAAHPENYGLCFTREAKKVLGEKKKENRKKSHQLTFRTTPELYAVFERICKTQGASKQKLLEQSLQWYCNAAICIEEVTREEKDG